MAIDDVSTESGRESLSAAVAAYRDLVSHFDFDSTQTSSVSRVGLRLPMRELLSLLPGEYVSTAGSVSLSSVVFLPVPDLLDQLRSGRVSVEMPELIACIPARILLAAAFEDRSKVKIPLPLVLSTMDSSLLDRCEAGESRQQQYNLEGLPDLFVPEVDSQTRKTEKSLRSSRQVLPAVDRAEKAIPAAATTPPVSGKAAEAEAQEVALPAERAEEPVVEVPGPKHGIDVNRATLEQLLSMKGIDPTLARRILEYRAKNGRLGDIFSLRDVEGVDDDVFAALTGMSYNPERHHRASDLARLLGIAASELCDIEAVARGAGNLPDFDGCIVSDSDGNILAASNREALDKTVGAAAHGILSKIRRGIGESGVAEIGHATVSVNNRLFSMVSCADMCLTVVHRPGAIARESFDVVLAVRDELAWALGRRLYVGK